MAQGERRGKAVLAAALAWHGSSPDESLEKLDALNDAIAKYKEVMAVQLPVDPMAFTCPHCGADRPGYGWHLNAGDTGPFAVVYLTCFCGECKNILGVSVTTFRPGKEIAEKLMKDFAGLLAAGGKAV